MYSFMFALYATVGVAQLAAHISFLPSLFEATRLGSTSAALLIVRRYNYPEQEVDVVGRLDLLLSNYLAPCRTSGSVAISYRTPYLAYTSLKKRPSTSSLNDRFSFATFFIAKASTSSSASWGTTTTPS